VLSRAWKLQVSERPPKTWLFDLNADPTEQVDVAGKLPAKVAELKALLAAHNAEQEPSAWPSLIEAPVTIDHSLAVADRAGDEYVYWAN
jgi:uncharacterized sulfatase